eukprot:CAMPEP_0197693818 /NCGR_PEP_ID=MMETSP1338-20131121/113031_1 /TAXON_ID=43686 ORGANISM="Pelagodinium beii, Strain RCC1491" /NCGR_SAMPLE_ID=MMETSP1338 /ASSEMBLY_ACC=CAM_ASM_000754 /LENGTH=541 /DNA_ID=CAMNT_0043276607 /DNA_START=75 /DNA_END=1697 /DNA_ORIENTATION=+
MTSADILCVRSMEVKWEDGTGIRQSWSSWGDELQNGWYEAEKLLPSSATDISVHFQVHGLGGPWDVWKVDRRRKCEWIVDSSGKNKKEVIWLKTGDTVDQEVDAIFELAGPFNSCYIARCWNSASAATTARQPWEYWPDRASRPRPEPPCATLEAADGAAPLDVGLGNPRLYLICTTKRVCAAARELVETHRRTLSELRKLDTKFTGQWLGVNMGTSASAGLGIASAVLLFTAPPVGIGLGVGSAVTGGLAYAGDVASEGELVADFRSQLSRDARDAFVVAELLKEWLQARQALVTYSESCENAMLSSEHLDGQAGRSFSIMSNSSDMPGLACWGRGDTDQALTALDTGLTAGAVAEGAAATGTRVAQQLGQTVASAASQVLGIAGALISTGMAIRGWSSTKASQTSVRRKLEELLLRILQLQHLLASLDRLECPVCADGITLADSVSHCSHSFHCFHKQCVQRYGESCPICHSELDAEDQMLVDSVEQHQCLGRPRRKQRSRPVFSTADAFQSSVGSSHQLLPPNLRTLSVHSNPPDDRG